MNPSNEAADPQHDFPLAHKIRLPGFVSDKEVGVGDVIKRATSVVGIRPCGSCIERAASLNRWLVFSGRR